VATRALIKTIMDQELTERAPERREAAKDTWPRQKLSFFFPSNEDTVDLCAIAVLDRALEEDGTRVTASVTRRVRDLISTATVTDDAITMIFLATAQPLRVRDA
jgi:hypothetical protein